MRFGDDARFLMPLVLFLHTGFAACHLRVFTTPALASSRKLWGGICVLPATMHWILHINAYGGGEVGAPENGYASADQLLRDIPDDQGVAALDVVGPFAMVWCDRFVSRARLIVRRTRLSSPALIQTHVNRSAVGRAAKPLNLCYRNQATQRNLP